MCGRIGGTLARKLDDGLSREEASSARDHDQKETKIEERDKRSRAVETWKIHASFSEDSTVL